jgi:hypothetical protein
MLNFVKKNKIMLLFFLSFCISFALRLFYLDSIPGNINPDSADTLQRYLQFKYQGGGLFGFNWNGAPAFNTYLIGFTWDLFGQSVFGLRIASAFISSLAVATTFFLGYLLTKRPLISFLVALSLSCNPWFLNFSRDGWENVFNSLFLILVVTGLYLYVHREKHNIGIVLVTLGSALGFYGYHPGKFFILSILLVFTIDVFIYKIYTNSKGRIVRPVIIVSAFLILTFPQALSTIEHGDQALGRIKAVSIFNQADPLEEIKNSIWRNIKGFIFFDKTTFTGYLNARYLPTDHSPIIILLLPFFLSGLIVALKKYPYLLLTFFIVLFLPQIFSQTTPDGARAVHIVPLMYTFILLGIVYAHKIIKNIRMQSLYRIVIPIILVVTAYSGVSTYFHWITSSATLNARRPAVRREDYSSWIYQLQENIRQGQWGFNVGQWEIMAQSKTDTLPSQVLPAKTRRK